MPIFTWLQISDFHHEPGSAEQKQAFEQLIDLFKNAEECGVPRPELIVAAGDIVFAGADLKMTKPGQKTETEELLRSLGRAVSQNESGVPIFIVPGNHDVNFGVIEDDHAEHCRRIAADGDVTKAEEDIQKAIRNRGELGTYGKFSPIFSLCKEFQPPPGPRGNIKVTHEFGDCGFARWVWTKQGCKVQLVGHNTSWFVAKGVPPKCGYLSDVLVNDALAVWGGGDAGCTVVVMHHPFWDQWREEKTGGLPDTVVRNCDILLTGHRHCQRAQVQLIPRDRAFEVGCGPLHTMGFVVQKECCIARAKVEGDPPGRIRELQLLFLEYCPRAGEWRRGNDWGTRYDPGVELLERDEQGWRRATWDKRDLKANEEAVKEEGEERGHEYADHSRQRPMRRSVFEQVIDKYLSIWHQMSREFARTFFSSFVTSAGRILGKDRAAEPHLADVCQLLADGIPEDAVHMDELASVRAHKLVNRQGYARLLRAIWLMGRGDHAQALNILNDLQDPRSGPLPNCFLAGYTRAMCLRKLGYLMDAEAALTANHNEMERHEAAESPIHSEACGGCHENPCDLRHLLADSYRALGTVLRRQGLTTNKNERDDEAENDAMKAFKKAAQYAKHAPDGIQGDVAYSYGYFLFERAYIRHRRGLLTDDQFRDNLAEADQQFQRSRELKPLGPAQSRLAIVYRLLGKLKEARKGFHEAAEQAGRHPYGENLLTLAFCRFGVLLVDRLEGKAPRLAWSSHDVLRDLLKGLLSQDFSQGARYCHAFDIQAIKSDFPDNELKGDRPLWLTYRVMVEYGNWDGPQGVGDQRRRCVLDWLRSVCHAEGGEE